MGEVIKVGGDVMSLDWKGNIRTVSSLVESVVLVVVIMLG